MTKTILNIILLLSLFLGNINYIYSAEFIQSSSRQNSSAVATNDPVTSVKWNSLTQDIANIIKDIGSLKNYIDSNMEPMFTDTLNRLEQNTHDIRIGRNLLVLDGVSTSFLDIPEGGIKSGTILTENIKDGEIKREDLNPDIELGGSNVFDKNNDNIYYSEGNTAIGSQDSDERLTINGNINILSNLNGIIFPDGTFQTTKVENPSDNMLIIEDQEINGNKIFNEGITLSNNDIVVTNISNSIDNNITDTDLVTEKAIKEYIGKVGTQTNAVCGMDHLNNIKSSETPDQLCLRGSVAGTPTQNGNEWNWTCNGIDGGNNISCMANTTGGSSTTNIINNNETIYEARYIRDYANGSEINASTHWVEIKAIENGSNNNLALNKTPTYNGTLSTAGGGLSESTNGNTSSSYYTTINNGSDESYLEIDLGNIYDLKEIQVWHYYSDSRTYNRTKTEISKDGINWYPIFDSTISGTYSESSTGKTHSVPRSNVDFKSWSDNTYAKSCNEYKNPPSGKEYSGDIGDGIYRIKPNSGEDKVFDVFCDMTTQDGGWTMVLGSSKTHAADEYSWKYRDLLLNDAVSQEIGNLSTFDISSHNLSKNYKSGAYHNLSFSDLMVTISDGSLKSYGTYNIGNNNSLSDFITNEPIAVGSANNSGYPMENGTFAKVSTGPGLCTTNIYFNVLDIDNSSGNISNANNLGYGYSSYDNSSYGPAFSQFRNSGSGCVIGHTDEPGWSFGMSNADENQMTFYSDGTYSDQFKGLHTNNRNLESMILWVK